MIQKIKLLKKIVLILHKRPQKRDKNATFGRKIATICPYIILVLFFRLGIETENFG